MESNTLIQILFFAASLFLLIKGSDLFVTRAEKIGLSLGISPFIIGVTIVAMGTSLPELASSIASVLNDKSEIVSGNVIGSNISNLLLVLGLVSTLAKVVPLGSQILDSDLPFLVGSAVFLLFSINDDHLSMTEAILFLLAQVAYIWNSVSGGKIAKDDAVKSDYTDYLFLLLGGVLIYYGSVFTIESMTNLATIFHIDESIIAITLLALGTSLPEVSVSLTAINKGNSEIAVGNVLGSNIFNTFSVMAISSFFGPLRIPEDIISFSLPFMVAITALFAFVAVGGRMNRGVGILFLLLYSYFIYAVIT